MNTTNTPKDYSAKVYYSRGNAGGGSVFKRASGWCYEVFFQGERISCGCRCRSEQSAQNEANEAVARHMGVA